jgi:hypothetical protein
MPPSIAPPAFLTRVAGFGRFGVLDAPATGYFGLVDVLAAAKATRLNVYDINKPWVRSDWPDADQYVRLDFHDESPGSLMSLVPGSALPAAPPAGAPAGSVSNERQTGQVYEADLDVARPAWTVFRMSYHFCWKAYVDGVAQQTAMLTPGFLGVQVAPGRHHIVCRYEPGNWKLYLAAAGLAITMLLVIGERLWLRQAACT